MFVWGLVLVLMGAAMTITEVAAHGLGRAGFELTVMFAGIGLLIALKHLNKMERDDGREADDESESL